MLNCAILALSALAMPTFLVSGATEGIGLATAHQLVDYGHTVHGRDAATVERTVGVLTANGQGDAAGYTADLSSMAAVRALAADVASTWPRALDGLLNNAGSFDGDYSGWRLVTSEGNEYTLAVNVLAPYLLTSLLLPALRASGAGRRRRRPP